MSAVPVSSLGESPKTLIHFRSDVSKQVLCKFMGHNLIRKDGSYMDGTVMSIFRLDA